MATFTEDWSGHTPGAAPDDYTVVGDTSRTTVEVSATGLPAGALGSQALLIEGTLAEAPYRWTALLHDTVESEAVTEVLSRWYVPAPVSTAHDRLWWFGGASHYGTWTYPAEPTIAWSGGASHFRDPSTDESGQIAGWGPSSGALYEWKNTYASTDDYQGVWVWVRHRCESSGGSGSTTSLKLWVDGDSEPGSWFTEGLISWLNDLDDDGPVGIAWQFSNENNATVDQMWCDWFSVGTGSDTAPSPPDGPTYVDGAFSMSAAASMSVAGVRSPAVGVFSMSAAADAAIAGVRTPAVGAFSMSAAAALDITGVRTPAVGVFGMSAAAAMSFAGSTYAPQPVAYTLTAASRGVVTLAAQSTDSRALTAASRGTVALSATTTGTRTLAAASRGTVALEARS